MAHQSNWQDLQPSSRAASKRSPAWTCPFFRNAGSSTEHCPGRAYAGTCPIRKWRIAASFPRFTPVPPPSTRNSFWNKAELFLSDADDVAGPLTYIFAPLPRGPRRFHQTEIVGAQNSLQCRFGGKDLQPDGQRQ